MVKVIPFDGLLLFFEKLRSSKKHQQQLQIKLINSRLKTFIWGIQEVLKEVYSTRTKFRFLIQQLTANGLGHARGSVHKPSVT